MVKRKNVGKENFDIWEFNHWFKALFKLGERYYDVTETKENQLKKAGKLYDDCRSSK